MSNLTFSLFSHKRDTMPQVREASWNKLCDSFKRPYVRVNKDGWLFSPAKFDPAQRKKENVRELSMLGLDIDHNADFETLKENLTF